MDLSPMTPTPEWLQTTAQCEWAECSAIRCIPLIKKALILLLDSTRDYKAEVEPQQEF